MSRGLALPALFFVLFLPYGTLIVVFRAFSLIARPLFLPRRGLPPWANRAIAEYDRAVHVILA